MSTTAKSLLENKALRGRPTRNSRMCELFSAEFEQLASPGLPSRSQKKLVRALAQTMLVQGFTISEISNALSVPKSTVCLWRDKLDDTTKASIERTVLNSVSDRVLEFLNAALDSTTSMARACSEESYILRQSPTEVARLIEVLGNQAFRLIEAKQRMDAAATHSMPSPDMREPNPKTVRDVVPAVD